MGVGKRDSGLGEKRTHEKVGVRRGRRRRRKSGDEKV